MTRPIFYVSDRTGITAETLGHGLLTQFDSVGFSRESLRFIDTPDKAREAVARINDTAEQSGARPIVFSTLMDPVVREILAGGNCLFLDLFDVFIGPLERELGVASSHAVGRTHGLGDDSAAGAYGRRIEAVNYALAHDDGVTTRNFEQADVVLIGVSRSGKTPTCLYLGLRYGLYAANYPLTEEDLDSGRLPRGLEPHRQALYGLTIQPERLQQIRAERRPDSRYASLKQCRMEVERAEALYRSYAVPFLDTSQTSVEEIAAKIMVALTGRRRR
jgi:regulator of PEP synthase PpsR (kinase-PPPase family)